MADDITLNAGTGGDVVAADDISGVKYQRVKLVIGANNTNDGDVASGNPLPVTGTITAVTAISNALPAGTNNIGDVDVLTVPAPLSTTGGGTEATALRVTVASDSTGVLSVDDNGSTLSIDDGAGSLTVDGSVTTSGDVAHDAGDSGSPVKIGAKAESSPAGITLVADADRTDLYADVDGLQMVKPFTAYGDILSERVTDTGGTSTAFSTFGATANARNFITSITVYNSSTTNGFVDIRDGTAGSVLLTVPCPALGGAHVPLPLPLRQPTANTALAYDVSSAISTVYISVVGFKSKA